MASEQELAQSAVAHAKKTSWTWDRYLEEVKTNPDYAYKNTEWYRAGKDLNTAKTASPSPPSPGPSVADAQARMFLAQEPLDCLQAPAYMIPVCTADKGYGHYYTPEVVQQLRSRFPIVEAWCDCRSSEGTPYGVAVEMVRDLGLNGPAWGQCETEPEFDHAYQSGARRMIGQLAGLRPDQQARIGSGEVHLAFELYRNVMPWQVPDYGTVGAGVGGNAIGCYASSSEGAVYTPVSEYKSLGYYASKRDSVYGVGLTSLDWQNL